MRSSGNLQSGTVYGLGLAAAARGSRSAGRVYARPENAA
jgi:hypothetical protein